MALNPWDYAVKTKTEFAEQTALFMWAAMARRYGVAAANDPLSYSVRDHAGEMHHAALSNEGVAPALMQLEWLHSIKNEEKSGSAIVGARNKQSGLKAGVPDVFLPVPAIETVDHGEYYGNEMRLAGLYIELKRRKGEKSHVSDEQSKFGVYALKVGYAYSLCYGWEAARDEILRYLEIQPDPDPEPRPLCGGKFVSRK